MMTRTDHRGACGSGNGRRAVDGAFAVRPMTVERNVMIATTMATSKPLSGGAIVSDDLVAADAKQALEIGAASAARGMRSPVAEWQMTKDGAAENIIGATGKISAVAKANGALNTVFIAAVTRNWSVTVIIGAGVDDIMDGTVRGRTTGAADGAATTVSVGFIIDSAAKVLAGTVLRTGTEIADTAGGAVSALWRATALVVGGDTTTDLRGSNMRGGGLVSADRLIVGTDGPPSLTASASAGDSAIAPRYRIEVDSESSAARDATSAVRTCLPCVDTLEAGSLVSMPFSQRPMPTRMAS